MTLANSEGTAVDLISQMHEHSHAHLMGTGEEKKWWWGRGGGQGNKNPQLMTIKEIDGINGDWCKKRRNKSLGQSAVLIRWMTHKHDTPSTPSPHTLSALYKSKNVREGGWKERKEIIKGKK